MTQSLTQARAAIVGLGRIAWRLEDDELREKPATHAGAILSEPHLRLSAGADLDPQAREDFHQRFKIPVFSTLKDMLRAIQPQLLVIATPPDSHKKLLQLGVSALVPVIVCEKPLCMPGENLTPILRDAEKKNLKILVNHERRYSADWRAAKELILNTRLGTPLGFHAKIFMGRTRHPSGVLLWDGTHMLDALRFLFPGPWKILKKWETAGVGSLLGAFLRFGKVEGTLEVASGRDHLVFELEVSFSQGKIRVGNGIWEVWESRESPFYRGFKSLVRTEEKTWGQTGYFSGMMHDAALSLQPGHVPASTGWDGLEVLKIIKKISGA